MENSFKTLLEKAKNAGLINESESDVMLNQFDDYVDQQKELASGSAFKDGYEQGYSNAKAQAEVDTKQALDELLAKCDEEAAQKLQTVIETLNDDHAAKLQEVYDLLQSTTVPASELDEMDADHTEKLKQVVDMKDKQMEDLAGDYEVKLAEESAKCKELEKKLVDMDNDHAEKLKIALEHKETIANEKLRKVKALLNEEKQHKVELLGESIEKFLNYALQDAIPAKKLVSEAKYNAAIKSLDKIGSILKINSVIQESKDGVFQDYENKISEAKKQTNSLMMENAELKLQLKKKEARILLESKTARCTPAEAAFLKSYFSNATSPSTIEEQIDEARSAYKRLHDEKRSSSIKETKSPSSLVSESKKNVRAEEQSSSEKKGVVTESVAENQDMSRSPLDFYVGTYANMLKSSKQSN